jgi:hypothetical protein
VKGALVILVVATAKILTLLHITRGKYPRLQILHGDTSTDNVGVKKNYELYGSCNPCWNYDNHFAVGWMLVIGTTYTFTVKAVDYRKNSSISSMRLCDHY